MATWRFWIDVGGTFTDCLAAAPDGTIRVIKVLSSGMIKTHVAAPGEGVYTDAGLVGLPARLLPGAVLRAPGDADPVATISGFDPATGRVALAGDVTLEEGRRLEIDPGVPAPLLAIATALGIAPGEDPGPIEVRLGTTRATNALLERKGANTALLITAGLRDLLLIGNQNRPRLFDLNIRRPAPLYSHVVEVTGRLDVAGREITPLDEDALRGELARLRAAGVRSLAVVLMHAWANGAHEERVAQLATEAGFEFVALSHRVASAIKMVPRGDTTVVDAYLTPVVRDYLRGIESAMPRGRLLMMTSGGGLAPVGTVSGKDLVLSGPAGGVLGVAAVARAAGAPCAIGFDMGGTSTDVSRFDGEFEYEYETEKAGVRLVTPMLSIETVAAGGGSICGFDGQRLTVGPESAGARPGPTCYGAGGPLTVTDMNVLLGRVRPERFPFALDCEAVEARVRERIAEIAAATGEVFDPVRLAEGYLRIANAKMAEAIRRISMARGYDLRRYALVSFGGAGGQHACALATELGMPSVLLHPWAGVLSAYGIGRARLRRFASRTVLLPLEDGAALAPVLADLESEARTALQRDGVGTGAIVEVRRLADLRYRGQGSTITVPVGEGTATAAAFEAMHRQLYGYIFPGRSIEVVSVRIEAAESEKDEQVADSTATRREITPTRTAPFVVGGGVVDGGLIDRSELQPGDVLAGPALVTEDTSVIVVEPGWEAELLACGVVRLNRRAVATDSTAAAADPGRVDPVLLEIFNNHFASIAEQMGVTLRRTSLSVNVKERLDYSCAIFTRAGDLVVNAPHMPVHLGSMSECVRRLIADVSPIMPGDVLITNDPMRGGSHIPDVTVVTPVHGPTGELIFFVASRAHHAEIGGKRPGSMPPDSTNLAEEGVLIRHFKVLDAGRERFAELRALLESGPWPSRNPTENIADIQAQIAANQTGVRELMGVIAHHTEPVVLAYMQHIQDAAEAKIRRCLASLPDGTATFREQTDEGDPLVVTITVAGESATIDFTGTAPPLPTNLNANRGIVTAAVLYCLRCLIDEDIPLNAGVLKPVRLVLPECFLNPPEHPDPAQCAAVVGGNVETSQRCVDAIFGALGVVAASQGTMNNLTFGNARFGYYETICGGSGAGPGFHGTSGVHTHMTNTRLTDPEVLESQYPVRLHYFSLRPGSGGRGRWRGGDGIIRELEFLEPVELSMLTQRRTTRPYGMKGGEPGAAGLNLLRLPGESVYTAMPPRFTCAVPAGTRLRVETPGGGGWGAP